MKKIMLFAGIVAACTAPAQLLQNIAQATVDAITEPTPAPQQQVVVQQPAQQVVVTPPAQQVVVQPQPQQVVVTPPPQQVVVQPAPTIVVPAGYQTCPRCGGRGKEEHAMGFKVKRCKLCNGKGYLRPQPAEVHHHHYRRRGY